MIDINKIRSDFPILNQKVYNKPLVYFDNGATTQKPGVVIDKLNDIFVRYNSNIHRGVHALSDRSSEEYEKARLTVTKFLNAKSEKEIIFTSGATGSINMVAFSFRERFIKKGMRLSSPNWSITPILSHGNYYVNEKEPNLRWSLSTIRVNSYLKSFLRFWDQRQVSLP